MATSTQLIETSVTRILGIRHPILLAGMAVASSPRLAAAVSNAGGLGVIGGGEYGPDALREQIRELKSYLVDKSLPFGVDLLIPKVGGNARRTNYDYSKGKLGELIDIIVDSGARVFVSAVGLPPKFVVDKLHAGGVFYMNMIGHPKHVQPAIDNGADMLCAQGAEAGGHTGEIPTIILIPAVAAAIRGQQSKFTGEEVILVAAGGLFNGQSLAAALMLGAAAVWIGTRFILSEESGAGPKHQEEIKSATFEDIIRTTVFSGRPLHTKSTPYLRKWEDERKAEMLELQNKGIIPLNHDMDMKSDNEEVLDNAHPMLMGKVAGVVTEKLSAKQIVDDMVKLASSCLTRGNTLLVSTSKL